jgi:hypothetical protein
MNLEQGWPLVAVIFIACAGGTPTQYAQGIPSAPRAPVFNPMTGAPITVGQPGYVGPAENLPRSPYGRTLPETPETRREPGIWAATKPPSNNFFEVEDLMRVNFDEDAREAVAAAGCIRLMGETFVKRNVTAPEAVEFKKATYPLYHWRCLIAGLYRHCVDLKHKAEEPHNYFLKLKEHAEQIEDRECRKGFSEKGKQALRILKWQLTGLFNVGAQ